MAGVVFSPAHKELDLADDPSRPELAALADAVANLLGDRLSGSGDSGMVLLASGTIREPVGYLDLTIPDSGQLFRFTGTFEFNGDRLLLASAVSLDGLNFINDPINFDSYGVNELSPLPQSANTDSLYYRARRDWDALIDYGFPGDYVDIDCIINPGNASQTMRVSGHLFAFSTADDDASFGGTSTNTQFGVPVNIAATIRPTLARAKIIRFQNYADGSATPPASGSMTGQYALWSLGG